MWKWAAALVFVCLACFGQAQRPLTREEIQVGRERWRLEWKSAPVEACGDDSISCPCRGFAYGQAGKLDLVRVRAGKVVERLALGKFFDEGSADVGVAVVRLHEVQQGDFGADGVKLAHELSRRPVIRVMELGDYNHDGSATEFYLQ